MFINALGPVLVKPPFFSIFYHTFEYTLADFRQLYRI
jgi:hypothetical protein